MPNPENIEPYILKPGETANPNGRPKGHRNFKTVLREMLAGIDTEGEYGNPIAKKLIQIAFGKEIEGDKITNAERLRALENILDRLEGKPDQKNILEQESQNTINLIVNGKIESDGK